jgi:hypothetical protein
VFVIIIHCKHLQSKIYENSFQFFLFKACSGADTVTYYSLDIFTASKVDISPYILAIMVQVKVLSLKRKLKLKPKPAIKNWKYFWSGVKSIFMNFLLLKKVQNWKKKLISLDFYCCTLSQISLFRLIWHFFCQGAFTIGYALSTPLLSRMKRRTQFMMSGATMVISYSILGVCLYLKVNRLFKL